MNIYANWKGTGCFKCYFRIFVKIRQIFFVHFVSHKGGSPSIVPLLLGILLSFLGIKWGLIWSYLFVKELEFSVLKALSERSGNIRIFRQKWPKSAFFASWAWPIWVSVMSHTSFAYAIVQESPKKHKFVHSLGRVSITKTWKKVLKSTHRGKITLYLKRIHQYLCAVKFL